MNFIVMFDDVKLPPCQLKTLAGFSERNFWWFSANAILSRWDEYLEDWKIGGLWNVMKDDFI
jgi:hypothetical protein